MLGRLTVTQRIKLLGEMPQSCAAFGCTNRRNTQTKNLGVTFHKFPKDPVLRKAWIKAVRRKDFVPNNTTALCSCHFKPEDFDRTGQTVRLRESVIPSVFTSFPEHLKKVPNKARTTRTSTRAAKTSEDPVPVPIAVSVSKSPEPLYSPTLDHHYALNPDEVKFKIAEAHARIEELQKQLRNAKDRERRQKQAFLLCTFHR